jgi:hypothetical protein
MTKQDKSGVGLPRGNDLAADLHAEHDALCSDIQQLEAKAKNLWLRLFKKQDRKAALKELEEKREKLALHESLYELRTWLMTHNCPGGFWETVDKCIRAIHFQRKTDDRAAILSVDALIKQTTEEALRSLHAGEDCTVLEYYLQCLKDYVEDRGDPEKLAYYRNQGFVECIREERELMRHKKLLEAEYNELLQCMETLKKDSKNRELGLNASEVVSRAEMIRSQAEKIRVALAGIEERYDVYERKLQDIKKWIACSGSET